MHSFRAAWLLLAVAVLGCPRTTNLVSTEAGPVDAGQPESGLPGGDGGTKALCGSRPCACDNGEDDDGDGQTDGFDSECTGPYDDDEFTFATGEVPNGNPRCADCFFDGNPGPDDGCRVPTSCSFSGMVSNGMGCADTCKPTNECIANCAYRTPNGCDCFGCCDVYRGTAVVTVLLTESCSMELLDDPISCPRCRRSASECKNDCGRCELCTGKTPLDLPADCAETDGIRYTCDRGSVCTEKMLCRDQEYCFQGCCVPVIL